ncbi:tyrosine-protein phosphatase [Anaerorhabdus sp.]|uniref:tyrosine-protein phosphatase n=1 Tax=Anaerorhabdus sp. TaxID=1872524 RepID=UPI002FCB7DFA
MKLSGFEKLSNTRDLGGIMTNDGKTIKYKKLIRSGRLYFASEYDRNKLLNDYSLKRILDFRNDNEILKTPDPTLQGVEYIRCPILKEHTQVITKEKNIHEVDFEYMKHIIELMDFNVEQSTIEEYPQLLRDEHSILGYKKFIDILLDDVHGSTLYHCSAGKDRVGVGTLLILGLLGVSDEIIIDDYLKTNYYLSERLNYYTQKATEQNLDKKYIEQFSSLCCVKESYIQAVLNNIHANYGTIESYAKICLGITQEDIEKLKQLYLE